MNWCRSLLKKSPQIQENLSIYQIGHAFVVPSYLEIGIQDRKIVVISDPWVHDFYTTNLHTSVNQRNKMHVFLRED